MSISVILPAYKDTFFGQAVESILSQTYTDFELVVINDNPGSKIKSIVEQYDDSRIHYYENKENLGGKDLIAHWNKCIKYATGEYLVLASDDDVYDPSYLDEMIALTKCFPTSDLYYCRIKYIDEHGRTLQISQPALEYETSIDFIYQRLFWGRKQALQEFFFRTSVLKKIGGFVNFPVAWYSDDATLAIMSSNGVGYSGKILFGMRMSGSNISTGEFHIKQKFEALKQYICWLDSFLPSLATVNEYDEFMKEKLLAVYRPILNDLRYKSLMSLPIRDSLIEGRELIKEKAYCRMTIYKQFLRRLAKTIY